MARKISRSLLSNLILRISCIAVLSAIILIGIAYSQIDRTLEILRDQTVQQQAQSIASNLKLDSKKNRVMLDLSPELRRFYARAGDTYQYIVLNEKGGRLFTSPTTFGDYFPEGLSDSVDKTFDFIGPRGRKYVGYTATNIIGGKQLYIQVAQTKELANTFSDRILDDFIKRLALIGIPFYLCLIIVISVTLRHGLAPLRLAAKEVSEMDVLTTDIRINEEGVPSEILPIVRGINLALVRLEKSIKEQQELTENVAHELRTPLSILKTHVDLLEKNEQTLKITDDIDDIIKMMNQMLDATRLDYADTIKMGKVDLAEVLSQACQDFFPLFIRAQKKLLVKGTNSPTYIQGDKDLIYRAICNLLDNALEYSPSKTPIEASLEDYTIRIKDYGKKIPEGRRKAIFERFRKDSSPTVQKSGAGLGLSIVKKTAELHGGFADLEVTKDKGNTFRMVFANTFH